MGGLGVEVGDQLGEETNLALSSRTTGLCSNLPMPRAGMVIETKWGKPDGGKPHVLALPHTRWRWPPVAKHRLYTHGYY